MNSDRMENKPEAEASVYIDDSSRVLAERLELCMLRTEGFTGETVAPELAPFFHAAFDLLKQLCGKNASGKEEKDCTETANAELCEPETMSCGTLCKPEAMSCGTLCKPEAMPCGTLCKPDETSAEYLCKPDKESTENLCKLNTEPENELCKLNRFWLSELSGLCSLNAGGSARDLVTAWETTLQLLLEAETAKAEQVPADRKEWKNILYSYVYDYMQDQIREYRERKAAGLPVSEHFITSLSEAVCEAVREKEAPEGKAQQTGDAADPAESTGTEENGKTEHRPEEIGALLDRWPMQVRLGLELFFGDRMKARLLECTAGSTPVAKNQQISTVPLVRQTSTVPLVRNQQTSTVPTVRQTSTVPVMLSSHQLTALRELLKKAGTMCLLLLAALLLAGCGSSEKTEETLAETTVSEKKSEYPGLVSYQNTENSIDDRFGVMHATVLDVQEGEKDGLFVYTLRDKEDPDNVWCLNSQNVGSIFCEVTGGKKVSVLFSGDIESDPDNLEFIAILDDASYVIKSVAGTTAQNMMNSFVVKTDKGGEMTFIKDNCKVDKDALSTDGSVRILVYYAGTGSGELYPVRVYKQAVSKR